MQRVQLPDGSVREYQQAVRPLDVAQEIGPGLAKATCGLRAIWPYSDSSSLPPAARSVRSGWPFTVRTAPANSSSAEALIRCTENASATPSVTASTAAALRHGWWRNSCQEKLRSKENTVPMAADCPLSRAPVLGFVSCCLIAKEVLRLTAVCLYLFSRAGRKL